MKNKLLVSHQKSQCFVTVYYFFRQFNRKKYPICSKLHFAGTQILSISLLIFTAMADCVSADFMQDKQEYKLCWPGEEFEFSDPEDFGYFLRFINDRPFLNYYELIQLIEKRVSRYPYLPEMPYLTVKISEGVINVKVFHINGILLYNQDYFYNAEGTLIAMIKESDGWRIHVTASKDNGLWISDQYIYNPEGKMIYHRINGMNDKEEWSMSDVMYINNIEIEERYMKIFMSDYGTFNLKNNPYGHCRNSSTGIE